jgi:putative colanic acid biosynthesis UDP-glucose lipid carrier transferase
LGIEQRFAETYAERIPLGFAPAQRVRRRSPVELIAKRASDILLGLLLLLLAAPVLLFVAVAIRLDSRGPALFRQTRLGLNAKPFDILKFRTMTVQENGAHIVQARANDPRITRLGGYLRKSSIDELPQLINVLKGEMSLIGPRPHARAHDEYYTPLIENYVARQAMKPGITGWAQVNGLRGETPTVECMRERVDLDVWYVEHFSLALDAEILVRTAFELFRQRNAH